MLVLAVDTSAKVSSVSLVKDKQLLAITTLNTGNTHSETLLTSVNGLMGFANVSASDIDLFAVSAGPGSFTGIRIGVALVKGLAFGHKKCAGVSTLEALAYNMQSFSGIICAAMDARCNQVYTAFFESDGENITRLCEDRAVSTDVLFEDIKKYVSETGNKVVLVGDGANLCRRKFGEEFVKIAPSQLVLGHASGTCVAAQKLFENGKTVSSGELVPNYLRLAQAEREKLQKEGKL